MKITKKKKEFYRDYLRSRNSCSDEALQQNVLDETIFKKGSFSLLWFSLKQILCSERKRLSCQRLLVFFFFWGVFLFCFVLFSKKTTFPMNFWGTASNISRLKGHKVPYCHSNVLYDASKETALVKEYRFQDRGNPLSICTKTTNMLQESWQSNLYWSAVN